MVYENLNTDFQRNRDKGIKQDLIKKTLLENAGQNFCVATFKRYIQNPNNTKYPDQLKSLSSPISFNSYLDNNSKQIMNEVTNFKICDFHQLKMNVIFSLQLSLHSI